MYQLYVKGRLMTAWLNDAREMKKTRTFFEQQKEMEAEGIGWTWPEGNDPISLMDQSVTFKVWPLLTPLPFTPFTLSPSPPSPSLSPRYPSPLVTPLPSPLQIFARVDIRGLLHCRQVCHSWKSITEDPKLWNRMDFAPFGKR